MRLFVALGYITLGARLTLDALGVLSPTPPLLLVLAGASCLVIAIEIIGERA